MSTAQAKVIQELEEIHALELALVQTLTAHIAMTPTGEYRKALERHLRETKAQTGRIEDRLGELGAGNGPVQAAYGLVQAAIGQAFALGKAPIDLVRGSGGEEKLLKNAKDEAASEALEIVSYDGLEALAERVGDERTATLARDHREQELAMLARLRELIPKLTDDMVQAEVMGDGTFDATKTGAAQTAKSGARTAKGKGKQAARTTRGAAKGAKSGASRGAKSGAKGASRGGASRSAAARSSGSSSRSRSASSGTRTRSSSGGSKSGSSRGGSSRSSSSRSSSSRSSS